MKSYYNVHGRNCGRKLQKLDPRKKETFHWIAILKIWKSHILSGRSYLFHTASKITWDISMLWFDCLCRICMICIIQYPYEIWCLRSYSFTLYHFIKSNFYSLYPVFRKIFLLEKHQLLINSHKLMKGIICLIYRLFLPIMPLLEICSHTALSSLIRPIYK